MRKYVRLRPPGRPKGWGKLSEAQVKRLIKAYEYGVLIEDICERFSIHPGTVNYYVRKFKVQLRQPQNHKKERLDDRMEALRVGHDSPRSPNGVAGSVGCVDGGNHA